jgi:hypothetical protein
MRYWAGLYSEDTWKVIEEGVELVLQTAEAAGQEGKASRSGSGSGD